MYINGFVFVESSVLLEPPGTLPDLPGWILGHPGEVEQKYNKLQKCLPGERPFACLTILGWPDSHLLAWGTVLCLPDRPLLA